MGLTISQLSSVPSLSDSDLLVIWRTSDGDTRKASLSTLRTWFAANFASPEFTVEISAPTVSGFNLQLGEQTENLWQIINPISTFAAGTITLPPVASCFDGQQIIVTCSEQINALTVSGNGASVLGAPTTLVAGGFFALRYNLLQQTWYCVSQSLGLTYVFETLKITSAIVDTNGNEIVGFDPVNDAVDYVSIKNGATASPVVAIEAVGDDAAIGLTLKSKGGEVVAADFDDGDGPEEIITVARAQTLIGKTLNTVTIEDASVLGHVVVAVAALGTPTVGLRKFVSDANATTFASIVAGGGANAVPVYADGTNWRIG